MDASLSMFGQYFSLLTWYNDTVNFVHFYDIEVLYLNMTTSKSISSLFSSIFKTNHNIDKQKIKQLGNTGSCK